MPRVEFIASRKTIEVDKGTSLLDAATLAGVEITAPCGGTGSCGQCRARIVSGNVRALKRSGLSPEERAQGWVLACATRVTDDVTVEAGWKGEEGGRIVVGDGPAYAAESETAEPLVRRVFLEVEKPSLDNHFDDWTRLERALQRNGVRPRLTGRLDVVRTVAETLRAQDHCVTATVLNSRYGERRPPSPAPRVPVAVQVTPGSLDDSVARGCIPPPSSRVESPFHGGGGDHVLYVSGVHSMGDLELVRLEPGDATGCAYGLAIDVGTTTCAVHLVDMVGNRIVATGSDYNGQLSRGADIISRINYARTPERREELHRLVMDTLNGIVDGLCAGQGIRAEDIDNAAVAGNTTMIHLLLGLDPEYIRLDPYTPTVNRPPLVRADEIDLHMNPHGSVQFAPGVGSYVGGDITAGLLITALATDDHAVRLFLDIGTNGEVVVGNGEWLMACAASAGPAFEGSGVRCGMRAAEGAIERVQIDRETGRALVNVIGGGPARGICGSGMIDLLAELWEAGLLDPSGKLVPGRSEYVRECVDASRCLEYIVTSAHDFARREVIVMDERDILNLLRTKAAVYSACALMLRSVGLDFDAVEQVYVAGGFGRYLDLEKSIRIGLLPDLPLERYAYLGNSSLAGAHALLTSATARVKATELADRITYLELNADPVYMDEYTAALFLPHTDLTRFPSLRSGA